MEKRKKVLSIVLKIVSVFVAVVIVVLSSLHLVYINRKPLPLTGGDISIPTVDLSTMPTSVTGTKFEYLYDLSVVDDSLDYVAHPDSVLLKNGNILTMYPAGHGKGAVLNKISTDGGLTWNGQIKNTPKSWEKSEETPTVYRLRFTDGKTEDKLIMISANPKWGDADTIGGFNCSISTDEGETWSEFELFYGLDSENPVIPIVAMASLTQLKENGKFVDKWMGFFHDGEFYNYKTILTFDENGKMQWSVPEKYFSEYRDIEQQSNMCEVEVIRSDKGMGDELCLISRSNTKRMNSLISFSNDEGKTWSKPVEAPDSLNGERHKAEYTSDGRLFITFRSIERGPAFDIWTSAGWIAWVGTYEDLKNGSEGQYRIKLAHIYEDGQTAPRHIAHRDTGYCGNVVLPDGTIVTSTYGHFNPNIRTEDGTALKTYICSKRINLNDVDELIKFLNL